MGNAFVFLWWSVAVTLVYAVAVGILALASAGSPGLRRRTASFWERELALSTWILAVPGLAAAAIGIIIVVGFVPLSFGIATGVIATRVSRGHLTRMHLLPLIFVGIVDALVVYLVVAYFDPGGGSAYPDTRAVALAAMLLVYMAVATANAVRIYVRGRSNSSPHSVALRRSEPPAATGFVDVGPPPELDAPPLIDERRQE